jgi:hypothetical protein
LDTTLFSDLDEVQKASGPSKETLEPSPKEREDADYDIDEPDIVIESKTLQDIPREEILPPRT